MNILLMIVGFIRVCLCILFYSIGVLVGKSICYFGSESLRRRFSGEEEQDKNNENNGDFWLN